MDKDLEEEIKYDLVILNGQVIDVVNEIVEEFNIGISNGKIKIITRIKIFGKVTIDAKGKFVSPGFIDFHSHVDGNEFSAKCLVRQGGTTTLGGERNLNGRTIRKIAEDGFVVNQGFFISHSFTLRAAAGALNPRVSATKKEINTMVDLAESFMDHGAYGICFGLEFVPGTSFREIIELSKLAKRYNRPVTIQLRKDGKDAIQYFDEVIQAAEFTGASIHLLELVYMVGIGGTMGKALEIIEAGRVEGLDITADSGVYDAYSVGIGTSIFDPGWEKAYGKFSAKDLLITSGIYMGTYCDEDLFEYLRREFPGTLVTAFVCDETAISMALKKPYIFVSTSAAEGPHYPGMGSPEVSGTFPRLIGRYVRDKKEINLMEAIRKITILPAERFGLTGKGRISENMDADIVIFDYNNIIDCAEYIGKGQPDAPPRGISHVIINGQMVVNQGKFTDNLHAGKLLKNNNQ
ncbi:MAG: amidohydrolase family protein [Eubacteriales bacterium]